MLILFFILFIITIILVGYLFFLKKEIAYVSKQMKLIKELDTNKRLLSNLKDPTFLGMVQQINDYIDLKKELDLENMQNNLALRELVLNISHDLRTPLTAIRGYLHMLEIEKLAPEQQNSYLKIVNQKIVVLNKQIDSFFELSKLDSAEFYYPLKFIDVYPILTEVLLSYYDEFEERNIAMSIELDEKLELIGNREAFEKIFHNLLTNTFQNAKSYAKLKGYTKGQYIVFQLKNDTTDFDVTHLPYLFDKFASFSSREDSNGLGLFIVKELVTKMQGKVFAEYDNNQLCIEIRFETSTVK